MTGFFLALAVVFLMTVLAIFARASLAKKKREAEERERDLVLLAQLKPLMAARDLAFTTAFRSVPWSTVREAVIRQGGLAHALRTVGVPCPEQKARDLLAVAPLLGVPLVDIAEERVVMGFDLDD